MRRRLIYSFAALILLSIFIYYPARLLLERVASPQYFSVASLPFEAGDVVLVNPSAYLWSDPQPGDFVHYRIPEGQATERGPGHGQRIYRLRGDRINRIIAKGGQKVTCTQGTLLIDGEPSPWMPLGTNRLPATLDLTIPENKYLIISNEQIPLSLWQTANIVPRGNILGRAYWRNQPLWRFGPIR